MAATAKTKSGGLIGKLKGSFGRKKAKGAQKSASPSPFERQKAAEEPEFWSTDRLNVVEKLLGMGYTTAGGADRVRQFAPHLHLDKSKSLLVLGAGLGGISLTLIDETDVWITGYEPDKALAKLGQESVFRAGLKRKCPIRYSTLEDLELKPKSFDAMLSLDTVHFVENKRALFEAVTQALRLDSEMLFTSFVLPDTKPPGRLVQAWAKQQPLTPYVWPGEAMMAMLNTLDLDVRPPNDVTKEYRACVLRAWIGFMSNLNREELLDKSKTVVEECARWAAAISAIDKGELQVWRFNAVRIAERRKTVEELMAATKG